MACRLRRSGVIALGLLLDLAIVITLLRALGTHRRVGLHLLLCMALFVASLSASVGHMPQTNDQSIHAHNDHDHDHSHDPIEELWWSLHGHAHDQIDHDHSPFSLPRRADDKSIVFNPTKWTLPAVKLVSTHSKPPERPPRA